VCLLLTQLCSTGFAGGFSVTAFRSRFTVLRIQSRPWGLCVTPASGGEELHLYGTQVIKDLAVSTPPPWLRGHVEGTDRSFAMYVAFPHSDYYADLTACRPWTFRYGSPLPTLHCPLHPLQALRVHRRGLRQNGLGGVLLNAPSPLWGSPIFLQGRVRLTWSPMRYHPRSRHESLLCTKKTHRRLDGLTSQARYVRVRFYRRALHA